MIFVVVDINVKVCFPESHTYPCLVGILGSVRLRASHVARHSCLRQGATETRFDHAQVLASRQIVAQLYRRTALALHASRLYMVNTSHVNALPRFLLSRSIYEVLYHVLDLVDANLFSDWVVTMLRHFSNCTLSFQRGRIRFRAFGYLPKCECASPVGPCRKQPNDLSQAHCRLDLNCEELAFTGKALVSHGELAGQNLVVWREVRQITRTIPLAGDVVTTRYPHILTAGIRAYVGFVPALTVS